MKARIFESVCVVAPDGCARNLASALSRCLPLCTVLPERPDSLAIVGSGPSVRGHLEELRSWPGEIWAINGSYNWLIGEGIIPQGVVSIDPLPGLAEYFTNPQPETTFYLSSICDPSVFDVLRGQRIMMWHAMRDGIKVPKGQMIVGGGTTAITRAPFLAKMLGWRDITIYGADSSFDETRYCYADGTYQEDSKAPVNWVSVNGEGPFPTENCLIKQVAQFGVIAEFFGPMMKFKCGGLLDAYLRAPTMDDSGIEIIDDSARTHAA